MEGFVTFFDVVKRLYTLFMPVCKDAGGIIQVRVAGLQYGAVTGFCEDVIGKMKFCKTVNDRTFCRCKRPFDAECRGDNLVSAVKLVGFLHRLFRSADSLFRPVQSNRFNVS